LLFYQIDTRGQFKAKKRSEFQPCSERLINLGRRGRVLSFFNESKRSEQLVKKQVVPERTKRFLFLKFELISHLVKLFYQKKGAFKRMKQNKKRK